jgi:hypothetical protein
MRIQCAKKTQGIDGILKIRAHQDDAAAADARFRAGLERK